MIALKYYLSLFILGMCLISCKPPEGSTPPSMPGTEEFSALEKAIPMDHGIYTINHDGHSFLYTKSNNSSAANYIVHSPSCPCDTVKCSCEN